MTQTLVTEHKRNRKSLRRKSLNLKISSEVVLMSKREAVGPGVTAPISRQ
uniref:Uncharacterized protein n=1 Tax=Staphylococcus phage HS04 TaxID=3056398 RepID=A0AA49X302_9VIRU|nr:MAG: hypothetical protein [Staphylococcus phage HS04]